MSLETVISSVDGDTAEEKLAALLADVSVPQQSILYTMSGVGKAFALAGIDSSILFAVGTFIKSLVGGESLYEFLMSSGKCDFTEPGIQQQLAYNAQVEAGNAARLAAVNVLISLGADVETQKWEVLGLNVEPTLETVTAAMALAAFNQWAAQVINEIIPAARSAGKTISETKTLIAES